MLALKCRLLFKLARNHGWARAVPEETLLDWAREDTTQEAASQALSALAAEDSIVYSPSQGFRIKNDPDSQAQVACRLVEDCGYTELRVEATLSRFRAAGGFDAYDMASVSEQLSDW